MIGKRGVQSRAIQVIPKPKRKSPCPFASSVSTRRRFDIYSGFRIRRLRDSTSNRVVADAKPGYPDRVELRDAEPGETLLLLNYLHQPAETPYKASHAIFVREGAVTAYDRVDETPDCLRLRPISLRAFDSSGMMVDADLASGREVEAAIERLLENPAANYIHAHYAKRGCYAARIDRA
jgi:hypothetical protein